MWRRRMIWVRIGSLRMGRVCEQDESDNIRMGWVAYGIRIWHGNGLANGNRPLSNRLSEKGRKIGSEWTAFFKCGGMERIVDKVDQSGLWSSSWLWFKVRSSMLRSDWWGEGNRKVDAEIRSEWSIDEGRRRFGSWCSNREKSRLGLLWI